MDKYVALLNSKWTASTSDDTVIYSSWCEDGSSYKLTVPCQLRSLLIELQHALYDKYNEQIKLKLELAQAQRDVEWLK